MNKQKLEKLIEKFDNPETGLVVSGYPCDSIGGKNYGIAWYTKEVLEPMARKYNKRFVVLAEKNGDNRPKLKADGKILLLRVFEQKRKSLYPVILHWMSKFGKIKRVYVHSEFGMTGSVWHFGLVVPFLALIRVTGKRVIYYSHNVVSDVASLSGHLNVNKGSWQEKLLNLGLRGYYKALSLLTDKIVVLDAALARRLAEFVPANKIEQTVIPVVKKQAMSKRAARKRLGISMEEKVVVSFGFVTWYKGADWLVKAARQSELLGELEGMRVILAGGPTHSLQGKEYYNKYYKGLQNVVKRSGKIEITGFVPEEMIGVYMAAADLVVLPYRGLIGSSGAMTHALSYGKPVMISREMSKVLGDDNDLLSFEHNKQGMRLISQVASNNHELNELSKVSRRMACDRAAEKVVENDYELIYQNKVGKISRVWFNRLNGTI